MIRRVLQRVRSLLEAMPQARSPHFQEPRQTLEAVNEAIHTVFDPIADIEAFHTKFGLEYNGKARVLPSDLGEFRIKFLREELEEFCLAHEAAVSKLAAGNTEVTTELSLMLDAQVDLLYVLLGTAYLQGFSRFAEAWRRVHEKNMQKVRVSTAEQSKRGSTYDIVKPDGWTAPFHDDLTEDHAHKKP